MEQIFACKECPWTTSNADGEEDSHSQRYLHTEETGHKGYVAAADTPA